MKNEIKETIGNIVNLLALNDEPSWAKRFEQLGSKLDVNYTESLQELKSLFGGMGSFNDLILHKNGIPLVLENDVLEDLRDILYKQLKVAMTTQQ